MTMKTYRGSCHCGAVKFEADFDLSQGTGKCNCSVCWKMRNWSVHVKPENFRDITPRETLGAYQFNTRSTSHAFCKTCGIRTYSWGDIPEIGGKFVSVQLSALDDLDPKDLADAPVKYMDGLHDNWWNPPAESRHL